METAFVLIRALAGIILKTLQKCELEVYPHIYAISEMGLSNSINNLHAWVIRMSTRYWENLILVLFLKKRQEDGVAIQATSATCFKEIGS